MVNCATERHLSLGLLLCGLFPLISGCGGGSCIVRGHNWALSRIDERKCTGPEFETWKNLEGECCDDYCRDFLLFKGAGYTLLHKTAVEGDPKLAEKLIADGADVNANQNREGETPLHWAARNGRVEMANFLLDHGANINASNKNGLTVLGAALSEHQVSLAALLVSRGAETETRFSQEQVTPLLWAAQRGPHDLAVLLVEKGAKVDAANSFGQQPLHHAAFVKDQVLADLLIARGADVNARESKGDTPLMYAAHAGGLEICRLLIAHGADVNGSGEGGITPLTETVFSGYGHITQERREMVRLLLASGADINARDSLGWTPLFRACQGGDRELAELFLQKGAERGIRDKWDRSVLDLWPQCLEER